MIAREGPLGSRNSAQRQALLGFSTALFQRFMFVEGQETERNFTVDQETRILSLVYDNEVHDNKIYNVEIHGQNMAVRSTLARSTMVRPTWPPVARFIPARCIDSVVLATGLIPLNFTIMDLLPGFGNCEPSGSVYSRSGHYVSGYVRLAVNQAKVW